MNALKSGKLRQDPVQNILKSDTFYQNQTRFGQHQVSRIKIESSDTEIVRERRANGPPRGQFGADEVLMAGRGSVISDPGAVTTRSIGGGAESATGAGRAPIGDRSEH